MKKVILMSLCVLFMASTSVFGYQVTGRVLDANGSGVGGASVTINCYPSSGGSLSDSDISSSTVPVGHYNGGWLATDCRGERIVVKAVKGALSGIVSFNASNLNADVKNVTIRPALHATAELHCEPEPVPLEPQTTEVSQVNLYVQMETNPVLVNGGTVDMHYNTQTMTCTNVDFLPPFDVNFSADIDTVAGTIHVEAHAPPGIFVEVQDGVTPTPFFTLMLQGNSNTPGKISNVTLTSSEIDTNDFGIISAFPSRTEYVVDGEPNEACKPYFRIADQADWEKALLDGYIYPMELEDWQNYMTQWQAFVEGDDEPHPDDPFLPAAGDTGDLYVYDGNEANPNEPNDAGLVMAWGDPCDPNGSFSSAWKFDHLKDPVYTNCIIQLAVTAPQMGLNGQINNVDFGLQNPPIPGGPIRSWTWNCGAAGSGAPITWGVPTTITIDTTKTGVGAATPTASTSMNNPAFNLNNVQCLIVSENGTWVGGNNPAPAPGRFQFLWNYWHWILVSPKTTLSKEIYKKWSQPPVVIDSNHPPIFLGWNEYSDFNDPCIVADDFNCIDNRPITDVHWWGSFLGWHDPLPPVLPQSFHLGIWTNVPDPNLADPCTFSHPGLLVWENYCDNYVWNFAGYDYDPRSDMKAAGTITEPCEPPTDYEPNEACFQFTQLLSEDEWFYQEPNDPCDPSGRVYWLSIAPIWDPCNPPTHMWGWKTRPHFFEDDAVSMQPAPWNPPMVWGTTWVNGIPIQYPAYPDPDSHTWDMTFELTTNQPVYEDEPIPGDLNADKIVNLRDIAILANNWLTTAP